MTGLTALLEREAGQTAWIFGLGPGLDWFEMAKAGPLRICINESLLFVQQAKYFFAHDERPIRRVAPTWPTGCQAILEPARAQLAIECGIPTENVCEYIKAEQDQSVLSWNPSQIAKAGKLYGCTSTTHSALHFCRLIGAIRIMLVAMEGRGGYAHQIGLAAPGRGHHFPGIRQNTIRALEAMGFQYEFIDAPSNVVGRVE